MIATQIKIAYKPNRSVQEIKFDTHRTVHIMPVTQCAPSLQLIM